MEMSKADSRRWKILGVPRMKMGKAEFEVMEE